jgi:hypothetical protein
MRALRRRLRPADPPDGRGVTVRMLKKSSAADAMNRVFAMERVTEPE